MSQKEPSSSKPILNALGGISIKGSPLDNQTLEYNSADNIFEWVDARSLLVVKKIDQSIVNSTVLQDDNELFFQAVANKIYVIRMYLFIDSTSFSDLKMTFTIPSGAIGVQNSINEFFQNIGQSTVSITDEVLPGTNAGTIPQTLVTLARVVMGSTSGLVRFQWSQRVSSGTPTVVQKGSTIVISETI